MSAVSAFEFTDRNIVYLFCETLNHFRSFLTNWLNSLKGMLDSLLFIPWKLTALFDVCK